jgi:hypothetical protein
MKPAPPAAKSSADATICLPGEVSWELWKQTPGSWTLAQTEADGPGAMRSASLFAFPVTAAFAVPIRAATTDLDLLDDVVDVQLERLSLKPDPPCGKLAAFRRVDSEEHATLVLASVLQPNATTAFPREAPAAFDLSPYLYYLPDDHLVIWKELGRLVFVVTRGDSPIYYHALSTATLREDTASEVEQLLMPLFTQGLIAELKGAVLWTTEVEPGAAEALANTLGVRVRTEARPKPAPPLEPCGLVPVAIAEGKIRAAKMRKVRNIASACALAYLAVPAFFGYRYYMAQAENSKLTQEVANLTVQYDWVKPTIERTQRMDALVNWDKYPIEQLSLVFRPLYENLQMGVRVTSVELERTFTDDFGEQAQIVIKGESYAQQQAIVYTQKIKAIPSLQAFDWKPKIENPKDGKIPFNITGTTKKEEAEPAS